MHFHYFLNYLFWLFLSDVTRISTRTTDLIIDQFLFRMSIREIKEEVMDANFRSDRQMILDSIIRSGGRLSEPDMAKQFKGTREYFHRTVIFFVFVVLHSMTITFEYSRSKT